MLDDYVKDYTHERDHDRYRELLDHDLYALLTGDYTHERDLVTVSVIVTMTVSLGTDYTHGRDDRDYAHGRDRYYDLYVLLTTPVTLFDAHALLPQRTCSPGEHPITRSPEPCHSGIF